MVVSATRGEAGQIRPPSATRRTLGAIREQELRQACQQLGVQQVVCLEYGDGTLQDVDQEALITQVAAIIRTFRPDVVITIGPDGINGHPDHIAIGAVTTAACSRSGEVSQFPEQIAAGLAPYRPARLYYSYFSAKHWLLWFVALSMRFQGTLARAPALLLLCKEPRVLRYSSEHFAINWYQTGSLIVEQGAVTNSLYLILSGTVEVMHEQADGTLRMLARLDPGAFFGEESLAHQKPRDTHVVAAENVTCLVFSPGAPMAALRQGEEAQLTGFTPANEREGGDGLEATTCIEVGPYVQQKIEAIAAYRSDPIEVERLPLPSLQQLMGREYFVRVYPAVERESELFPSLPAGS